ncbi:hypothetical protein CANCADRAFT_85895 [Tortispora caseinolytica NRRL Y-17796]|uniref:Histone acetyltransferase type B catalytic subunit n=1 Tax=Tortispora caseinolytica NRRL Y-17796 TaxID=767744 RepID=A0A1E4TKU6_9ASCO|nr:hypothetical protein CANCADRAFT_85895 [Tortispora caseinolytica NRRL Y-17796]
MDEYTVNSNEAITICLSGSERHSFNPDMTYSVFGENETIYGYKDLKITITIDASTFLMYLDVSYSDKKPDAIDIQNMLSHLLPEDVYSSKEAWMKAIQDEKHNVPYGTLISSDDTIAVSKFRAYDCPEFTRRLETLVPLFIEAGTVIDIHDKRWDVYLMYTPNSYAIIGFATVYECFYFDAQESNTVPIEEKSSAVESIIASSVNMTMLADDPLNLSRKRISQFMILPPYQRSGNGRTLYTTIFDSLFSDRSVKEICVEDPSEAFDDMRDVSDLIRLGRPRGTYPSLWESGFLDMVDPASIQSQSKIEKIVPRQFQRLVEMARLGNLNSKSKAEKKALRIAIKKRLFLHNKEALKDLERPDQLQRLDQAYDSVIEHYKEILNTVKRLDKSRSSVDQSRKKQKS